jgi:hypothetical protein
MPNPRLMDATQPSDWITYYDPSSQVLALSNSNTFADARPEIDAATVTVLLETPTLLRCSLPPISNTPVLDTYTLPRVLPQSL